MNRKKVLIAAASALVALGVLMALLLPSGGNVQSAKHLSLIHICGMMFTGPDQHGREADGTEVEDFCRWCYDQGAYTYETTMEEMIEDCAPRMAEHMGWSVDECASLLGAILPHLRRWNATDK